MANKNGARKVDMHMATHAVARGKRARFLKEFRKCGVVTHAATAAKIPVRSHYYWLKDDPAYKQQFEEATIEACEVVEREVHRRAVEGVERDVYQGGKKVGTHTNYSDLLLIFLMKKLNAAFRDRVEHAHGGTVEHDVTLRVEFDDHIKLPPRQVANLLK